MNFADILSASAARHPGAPAVLEKHGVTTYAELEQRASNVAAGLRDAGVVQGERVALSLPTGTEFLAAYFGVLKLGAVAVPLNLMLTASDIARLLDFCGARHYLAMPSKAFPGSDAAMAEGFALSARCERVWHAGPAPSAAAGKRVDSLEELMRDPSGAVENLSGLADQTAVLCFTSGTTGQPKAADLSHLSEYVNTLQFGAFMALGPGDVLFSPLSLAAGFGRLVGAAVPLCSGAAISYIERFHPMDAWKAIAAHPTTAIAAVPAMYYALLDAAASAPLPAESAQRLRYGLFGGAPMPESTRRRLSDALNLTLLHGYGLTEAGGVAVSPQAPVNTEQSNELRGLPGIALRIVDEHFADVPLGEVGQVIVRGPNVMKGYFQNEAANALAFRDGWLCTGDLARNLGDNRFAVVDRMVSTINRGGYKVYPAELEGVLETHPAIRQAVVLGARDERLGQEIIAYVMPAADESATVEELIDWARSVLPGYAYPRRIKFTDSFPLNPTGKVARDKLAVF